MKKKRVCLLFGGKSGEHEVSIQSATSVAAHIDPSAYDVVLIGIDKEGVWYLQQESGTANRRQSLMAVKDPKAVVSVVPGKGLFCGDTRLEVDIVFPVLHGTFGEDGTVQGLLEVAGIPYVGAGILGSALGMDKALAKTVWQQAGLPVVPFLALRSCDFAIPERFAAVAERAVREFGFPLFVKPSCAGSSVGVRKVAELGALAEALRNAFRYDTKALIEPAVSAREIECSVIGNHEPMAFAPGEIIPTHDFYDYEAKYTDPDGAKLIVPAEISETQRRTIQDIAVRAYRAIDVEGFARIDFFLEKKTGIIMLNEINTIPGFTNISMFPKMCQASGLEYRDIIKRLIDLGFERASERNSLEFSI